ncbi:hypothetical protein [Polycladomyces subterraneus]|uniref:Uncharacterized protein n=1 Tax=Polycladomyces subterraneus TaxID=1016997 RepID=A0ABT8IP63_9BACL|nr:hypothetical protein [Polycladomyces subterraneus]MDN4594331.1 hypothetical protein [Polycladomyces subterraneus]
MGAPVIQEHSINKTRWPLWVGVAVLTVAVLIALGVAVNGFLSNASSFLEMEPGVKLANEVDNQTLKTLRQRHLLQQGEELIAYYDRSLDMDGSEIALLTSNRLVYDQHGRITSVPLTEIRDITFGQYSDIDGKWQRIEVKYQDFHRMKVEFAPLEGGEVFYRALKDVWQAKKIQPASDGKGGNGGR